MCGIAGAVGLIDSGVKSAVQWVSEALRHRGPDGSGDWGWCDANGQGVEFSHRRLAIIDLSERGAQPMVEEQSGCVITYNGELYNYKVLKSELASLGVTFRSDSDTEVVLKSYIQWGKQCLSRFEGMFAFALWDPRTETTLIARDPLGIKPLYYSIRHLPDGGGTLLFASELTALLASDMVARDLDPDGLGSYLWNGFVVEPNTILKDVKLLEAGCCLEVSLSGVAKHHCYWSAAIRGSEAMAPADVEGAMEQVIGRHLIADVPLGIFLSGGVDSSVIAAMAARGATAPVETFCIAFPEQAYSEAKYARRVAEQIGSNHHEFMLDGAYFERYLDAALDALDQPSFDGVNTYYVSRAVAEKGLKVALAGTGGDELFGGYASFREIPTIVKGGRSLTLLPEGLRSAAGKLATGLLSIGKDVPTQTRWGKLADMLSSEMDVISAYQISYALYTQQFLTQLAPALAGRLSYGLPGAMQGVLQQAVNDQSVLQQVSSLESRLFLGQRLLRDTDACSMAVSLEVRVPLVDKALYTAVAQLPDEQRYLPLGSKQFLKRSIREQVPLEFFDRPKAGFELPMDAWLKSSLSEHGNELFFDRDLVARAGLDAQTLQNLWSSFLAGNRGIYWSRVWSLYVLLWWVRKYDARL